MAKTIEIKNVPDEVYQALETRAAKNGMTLSEYLLSEYLLSEYLLSEYLLSEYLLSEMEGVAAEEKENTGKPTMEEWLDRLESRETIKTSETSAEIIRHHRDGGHPEELG